MTGISRCDDIFGSLVGALENVGVYWAGAVNVASDVARSILTI